MDEGRGAARGPSFLVRWVFGCFMGVRGRMGLILVFLVMGMGKVYFWVRGKTANRLRCARVWEKFTYFVLWQTI